MLQRPVLIARCLCRRNGCTIGCDKCDGTNNHLGHGSQHFVYTGPKPMPAWVPAPGTMKMDPRSTQCIKSHHDNATNTTICDVPFGARSMCGEEATTRATICDSALRSESSHDQPAPAAIDALTSACPSQL